MIIFLWIAAAALCAFVASQKNRNAFVWFLIAIFITPLIALLALCAVPVATIVADAVAEPEVSTVTYEKPSPYMQALMNRG